MTAPVVTIQELVSLLGELRSNCGCGTTGCKPCNQDMRINRVLAHTYDFIKEIEEEMSAQMGVEWLSQGAEEGE